MKRLFKDPDSELTEFLTREYDINFLRARNIARDVTSDQFSENAVKLEQLVGSEATTSIIKNGNFIDYRNGSLENYLKLVRTKAGKFNFNVPSDSVALFYSIESLESDPIKDEEIPKISHNYRLFNTSDETSQRMLSDLINTGQLTVSENNHWSKSNGSGVRGLGILHVIKNELSRLCNEAELQHPKFQFTTGRNPTLIIPEYLRSFLGKIKNPPN